MPLLSQSVPKYRRHRSSGQATVTLGGRDHYLGPHGTKFSKLEYDRLVGEWIAGGRRRGAGGEQFELTITELVTSYKKFAEGYYKGGTLSNIDTACRVLRIRYGARRPQASVHSRSYHAGLCPGRRGEG